MLRPDTIAGVLFLGAGIALMATGATFPAGLGGLPGAGFFPQAIGAVMALLACALIATGRDERSAFQIGNPLQLAGVAGLLCAYLLLWGQGLFVVRTAVFLLLALRLLGQGWRSSAACSLSLTAVAYLAFDAALNVSLE